MNWLEATVNNIISHTHPALIYPAKRDGLQLEQFRGFNFSSMPGELAKVFERTKGIHLRYAGLSHRVSVDGAGQYVVPPLRLAERVSEVQASAFLQLYAELGVDPVLADAEPAGVLQQAYLLAILPDKLGRLRVQRFLPYQIEDVVISDPFAGDDVGAADRVVLVRGLRAPNDPGILAQTYGVSPWCARIVLTPAEAYAIMPDGARVGIYNPDGSNPLGRVPVVGTRRVTPTDDSIYLPGVAEDVLSCQIGLILALSDIEFIVRSQSHVKVIATGDNTDEIMKKLPDLAAGIVPFPEGVQVQGLTLNPPIEKYIRAIETTLFYMSGFRYLRPEAYQASIVTGSARRADAEGFYDERRRQEGRTVRLEHDLARLAVDSRNALQARALRLDVPELRLEYRYTRTPENRLQEAQALAVEMQNGLDSAVEEVMRREGCTRAVARERIIARLKDMREILGERAGESVPGLDKLANKGALAS